MKSPFQVAADGLRSRGYSAIPLSVEGKYPVLKSWSEYCSRLPTDEEHLRWMLMQGGNVGVCLGEASGIIALDFDDDADGLHARIMGIIPESPVQKRGAKGFTAFYRHNGERSHGYSVGKVRVLDLLSTGRQTVLPPSIHPTKVPYHWLTRATLEDTSPEELPSLTPAMVGEIEALFGIVPPRPASPRPQFVTPDEGSQLVLALSFIPPDDYDDWIKVGMALKQHLGGDGYRLWDGWSAQSHKYQAAEMPKKWRSFSRSDITVSTLFYLAKRHGYISPPPEREDRPTVNIIPGGNLMPMPAPGDADAAETPGLVGRIASWIDATAIYPQPVLSVAAGIACAGAAMAHKVQSPSGLRTNFYTLGLAPSGAGKDHARKCVMSLMKAAGMDDLLGGVPASGAGLLSSIRAGQGRRLIQWDEFGKVLKSFSSRNAGNHQREIPTYLMELFSCSNSVYAGIEYANHDGKMERKPIDQPCLSVYATTVAENFFAALTRDDAIDGFLARWLIVESREYALEGREPQGRITEPPDELVAELRQWHNAPSNCAPRGNLEAALGINPVTVAYRPEARAMIESFQLAMRKKTAEENAKRSGLSAVHARAAEHAIKLALVAHEGDSIGPEAMRWAIRVAEECARYLCEAIGQNIADNDFERSQKKLLSAIREEGGWIGHTALVRKTQSLETRLRNSMLENLVVGGIVEVEIARAEGTHKPAKKYRVTS